MFEVFEVTLLLWYHKSKVPEVGLNSAVYCRNGKATLPRHSLWIG